MFYVNCKPCEASVSCLDILLKTVVDPWSAHTPTGVGRYNYSLLRRYEPPVGLDSLSCARINLDIDRQKEGDIE